MGRTATSKSDLGDRAVYGLPDLRALNLTAIDALHLMFDPSKNLFCYRLKLESSMLVQEGLSPRYTMMTCLGLARSKSTGIAHRFDTDKILGELISDLSWIDDLGDLGLLLWLCAEQAPERLTDLCSRVDFKAASQRFRQAREGHTMQMAWFLTGLTEAAATLPEIGEEFEAVATRTYRTLTNNQGRNGVFGHISRSGRTVLRSHIGSFADQVYPIIALTRYGRFFKISSALERAVECAETICRYQGSLGQWWWHYSARSGKVIEKYPVYSVHQDGMAPMALFEVGEATGRDFTPAIYKGLAWITTRNERGADMRDSSTPVIWRSLYHKSNGRRQIERLRGLLGLTIREQRGDALQVRVECRPYHLGWLLYAFSGRE
jgi:hypothetical protein